MFHRNIKSVYFWENLITSIDDIANKSDIQLISTNHSSLSLHTMDASLSMRVLERENREITILHNTIYFYFSEYIRTVGLCRTPSKEGRGWASLYFSSMNRNYRRGTKINIDRDKLEILLIHVSINYFLCIIQNHIYF